MGYSWDFSFLWTNWWVIWQGLLHCLKLAATCVVCGLILGLIAGSARSSSLALPRFLGTVWIEAFRNIPAMVLIFWFFFGCIFFG